MTTFLLIRHGAVDALGRSIAGRAAGTHLNEAGRRQVRELCDTLAGRAIRRVYCSPLERTAETARPLAERLAAELIPAGDLLELDFGDWTGATFDRLESDPRWGPFNAFRSGTPAPGGESMLDAQARIVGLMLRLRDEYPDETLALVSHGDVIRAALVYFLGMPLDLFQRIEVGPGSVSVVRLRDDSAEVAAVNLFSDGW